ncbi:MAG: glycosyltransferase [Chloroflexi bacterium]|nr:glycosyltransferase [Chloroflexota bacterium]
MPIHRIVHLSKMTGTAGSEGHLLTLLDGLRQREMDAQLWILVEPDNPVQEYVDRASALGIPVQRLEIRRDLDPRLWRQLIKRFRDEQPDVVHTHLLHADLHGIPAAHWAGVPTIVSSRHNDDKFRRALPMRLLNRWLWRQTNGGIAISEAIRQFCIQVEGARPERIHTVHYGLDPALVTTPADARQSLLDTLHLPAETLIAGSVCRLIEQKGLRFALEGFAQIAPQVPQAHYIIAGDGALRSELEDQASALHLESRVHFLGWRSDAHAIMAGLDVLLAPSLWEGFGLVFLEAMALHVPIISTRVSAIPEVVVDGETGWLIAPQDTPATAAALLDALTHPDSRRARGLAGYERLQAHFTVRAMIERTLAIYRALETHS